MFIRTSELWSACARPRTAWSTLYRWACLARSAELSYGDVMRYRRELLDDRAFRTHLARGLAEIGYVFPGAAELYVVVRATKPKVVIETGVSSGISSAHILRALAVNGTGTLHSIDLPNVQQGSTLPEGKSPGWLVPHELRGRWRLHLGESREILPALLDMLDRVDIFLHDSDHSYEGMSREFAQVLPRLPRGGLLLSDDVHLHRAWEDFCTAHGLRPTRVGNFGVTRKGRAA